MRSKKVIALLISLTLLVSSVLPGTLAVSIDQDAASSSVTLTSGKQETPTPAPEEQQEQEDQNEQENICTCGSTDGTHAEDCPLYEAPKTLMAASAQTAGNENYPEGHVQGKIRIKINVKLVDANGNETNAPAAYLLRCADCFLAHMPIREDGKTSRFCSPEHRIIAVLCILMQRTNIQKTNKI